MICKRCGREFINPIPEVTDSEGIHEIATEEFCADCNRFVMNIIFRYGSAYKVDPEALRDPRIGGTYANS